MSERELTGPAKRPSFRIGICSRCGHAVRIQKVDFQANLNLQQDIFDSKAIPQTPKPIRWPHRYVLIASEIKRIVGNTGKMLDIGCGNGKWLGVLGDSWEKYGVELSPVASRQAMERFGVNVHTGPIESYRTEPDSFDLITAFAIIEHLSDPEYLVGWAYEHLKPGGLFVLMTGDRESKIAIELSEQWPLYWPDEHVHFFSFTSLFRLVEKKGFKIRRKEWRPVVYSMDGRRFGLERYLGKLKEILRFLSSNRYDRLYIYAQK
jgi:SAM-dependent methyltransferase